MWISNTATAVMILPVGMAIVAQLRENPKTIENENLIFGKALMLAVAYSASIGVMAALIGTPPNLVLAGVVQESYGIEITFSQWFFFGFSISILFLVLSWLYLTRIAFKFKQKEFPGGTEEIKRQLDKLGKLSFEEKLVTFVFVLTAFAWFSRSFLLKQFIPAIDDTIIAISSAILLFLLPTNNNKERLLDWSDTVKLPWGILILCGGGMALALGFENSGLAIWLGEQMTSLKTIPLLLLLLILIAAVNFLTEITSNLATPPNAVVFGSGYLKIEDMVKKGIWMNIVSIILLTLIIYYFLPFVWDLS